MSKEGWDYLVDTARRRAAHEGRRMWIHGVYNINARHYFYFVMVAK